MYVLNRLFFSNLAHSSPRCEGLFPPTTRTILHQPHSKPTLPGSAFFLRRVFTIRPPRGVWEPNGSAAGLHGINTASAHGADAPSTAASESSDPATASEST